MTIKFDFLFNLPFLLFFFGRCIQNFPFPLFYYNNGVFALSEVDCGFKQRLPQTKDHKQVVFVTSPLSK